MSKFYFVELRGKTRQSIERFEKIAKELNAKVIIQHEKNDIDKLPKIPTYLN